MYKVRYMKSDGKVNLIGNGPNLPEIEGHEIIEVKEIPRYDGMKRQLYVINGKVSLKKIPQSRRETCERIGNHFLKHKWFYSIIVATIIGLLLLCFGIRL